VIGAAGRILERHKIKRKSLMENAMAMASGTMARRPRLEALTSLKAYACMPCLAGPSGKEGHSALRYVMLAPETDRSFYRCSECGERWMRTAGMTCRYDWMRYEVEAGARKSRSLVSI
jgi:hypothetical protein